MIVVKKSSFGIWENNPIDASKPRLFVSDTQKCKCDTQCGCDNQCSRDGDNADSGVTCTRYVTN